MQLAVAHTFQQCGLTRAEWDAFMADRGGLIFQSYDWCRLWWLYYGERRQLRLLTLHDRGRLVGILPLFVETLGAGLAGLRIARLLGADCALGQVAVPVAPAVLAQALPTILARLFGPDRCQAVGLGPLAEPPILARALAGSVRQLGLPRPLVLAGATRTSLALRGALEDHLAGLAPPDRSRAAAARAALRRAGARVRVIAEPAAAAAAFRDFAALHEAAAAARGEAAHLSVWPHAAAFHADLVDWQARQGRLQLILLEAGGQPLACHYAYGFGPRLFRLLSACAPAAGWPPAELELASGLALIECAIGQGYRTLDLGDRPALPGAGLGGIVQPVRSTILCASEADRAHARLLLAYAKALDLVYYRCWVRQLAPLIPWGRGPLWPAWLRLRL
jgi:CelD/BcsL family acetyltransferase involved in cellulose biosynthesis